MVQALEGVVHEPTEHVSLILLHQCGPGVTAIRKTKPRMKKPGMEPALVGSMKIIFFVKEM